MPQALTISSEMCTALAVGESGALSGRRLAGFAEAAVLAAETSLSREEKVRRIFLLVYSRAPKPKEIDLAMRHLSVAKNQVEEKASLEDLLWALINTKEFMFNH